MNIDTQKEKLEAEKALVISELSKIARQEETGNWVALPEFGDGERADELDNADLTEAYQEHVALVGVLEAQYRQIEKALLAIENGTYGVCEHSGQKISDARLEAYPAATTCVEYSDIKKES